MRTRFTRFAIPMLLFALHLAACAASDGPAQCVAAGGRCVIGLPSNCVGLIGSEDYNPVRNPGGGAERVARLSRPLLILASMLCVQSIRAADHISVLRRT